MKGHGFTLNKQAKQILNFGSMQAVIKYNNNKVNMKDTIKRQLIAYKILTAKWMLLQLLQCTWINISQVIFRLLVSHVDINVSGVAYLRANKQLILCKKGDQKNRKEGKGTVQRDFINRVLAQLKSSVADL